MNFKVELPKLIDVDYVLEDYGHVSNNPKENGV